MNSNDWENRVKDIHVAAGTNLDCGTNQSKIDLLAAKLKTKFQPMFFQKGNLKEKWKIRVWLHNSFSLITNKNRVIIVTQPSAALMQQKTTLVWVTVCVWLCGSK